MSDAGSLQLFLDRLAGVDIVLVGKVLVIRRVRTEFTNTLTHGTTDLRQFANTEDNNHDYQYQ